MTSFRNISDDTFIGDSDTPSVYTGSALKIARVNAGETALEFATLAGIGDGTYLRLDGTNDPMTGDLTVLNLTIGVGGAGVDYTLTFDGETNDGLITWKEDEDYFLVNDDVFMFDSKAIYFRDSQAYVYSSGAGILSLVGGTSVDITTNDLQIGKNIDADVKITLRGNTNDGILYWMEDENYFTLSDGLVINSGDLGLTGTRVTKGWFTDLEVTNAIAGSITGNAGTVTNGVYTTDAGTVFLAPAGDGSALTGVLHDLTGALLIANNLSDLNDAGTARTNLGLIAGGTGDIWVEKAGDIMSGSLELQNTLVLSDSTSSVTGVIYKGANQFLHNFHHPTGGTQIPTGRNVFVGELAGNFTTGGTATLTAHGSFNVGIGYSSLSSLTIGWDNTAIGYQALYSNSSGAFNTAIGFNSLCNNSTGNGNVVIGSFALQTNSTTDSNTAIGAYALRDNVAGYNTAIGYGALRDNSSGSINTAVGYYALVVNSTGIYDTAVGGQALYANSTGNNNVAMGYRALYTNSTGNYTTAIGAEALYNNTASYNIAIGYGALRTNTSGAFNTAIGTEALFTNSTAEKNTAIGYGALRTNSTGSNNTAIGYASLYNNTASNNIAMGLYTLFTNSTGTNNVAIGINALYTNSTGTGNVIIGYQAGYNETGSNKLYIANSNTATPLIYGEFPNTLLTFNSATVRVTGDLWIGNNLDIDPAIVFDGLTNDGQITWMEDEDLFNCLDTMKFSGGTQSSDGSAGVTGSFLDQGGNTITVKNGLIVGFV